MKKGLALHCFSPPVMMATFVIEIAIALWVVMKYVSSSVTRLATAILVFLAVFQMAEWNVCEGSFGMDSLTWSRIGYVAITLLPPLGFHLATKLAGKKQSILVPAAYMTAAGFAGFFLFSGHGLTSQACLGNYVIFQTAPEASKLYGIYYYGWLIIGLVYMLRESTYAKKQHVSRALRSLAIGYTLFIVPTTLVNIVDPSTIAGIPSIMCGFAVLLALMIGGQVLPHYYKRATWLELLAKKISAARRYSRG